ncbi:protein ACCELERATED CELL DEATH 6-like [Chenopodium quinoa]|uniref:protein ACCELERATED CELL DEATH 6-like n=1 Tax=Chenopodium quinoa TaxID=63459 RepID=UPI000B77E196|nr:protein ACCELERATED CELL DEATH 6-like [Chenopodium quinoa]
MLEEPNKVGKSPNDLLAESPNLPRDIEKMILEEKKLIGVLSKWGIPSSEMKTYVNTIGIIAALLTTITFTTAFTIPGGFLQDIGTPVLIDNIMFQAFMILDVFAMCLSMMVLYCLLWIMATNNRKNSVMILDFSVTLVLASFFTTLLTFMAGVCATTLQVKAWMAYVALALCSLLMVVLYLSKNATVICERKFLRVSRKFPKLQKILKQPSPIVGSKQIPSQGSPNIV